MASSISTPAGRAGAGRSRRNIYLVVLAIFFLIAVPLLIAASAMLWDRFSHDGDTPRWLTPAVIHATTGDGMVVKAQVSLDIADADARTEVEQHMDQIGLLLQGSFAGRTKEELSADGGLAALTRDMQSRLNDYLDTDTEDGVRSVVVADILYSRP